MSIVAWNHGSPLLGCLKRHFLTLVFLLNFWCHSITQGIVLCSATGWPCTLVWRMAFDIKGKSLYFGLGEICLLQVMSAVLSTVLATWNDPAWQNCCSHSDFELPPPFLLLALFIVSSDAMLIAWNCCHLQFGGSAHLFLTARIFEIFDVTDVY